MKYIVFFVFLLSFWIQFFQTLLEVTESDQKTALFSWLMTCLPDKFGKYMVPYMFENEQDENLVTYILEKMLISSRVPFRFLLYKD